MWSRCAATSARAMRNWRAWRRRRGRPARRKCTSRTCARSSSPNTCGAWCARAGSTKTSICSGTSIARPLLAKKQVEVALRTGCDALAHGCTGKGNDQVRFELTYKALAPHLPVIAPWREWSIVSREDALEYAAKHNVPVSQSTKKIYSRDRNIWHISHEGGALEDPANAAPDEIWMLTAESRGRAGQARRGHHRLRKRRAGFARWAADDERRGACSKS